MHASLSVKKVYIPPPPIPTTAGYVRRGGASASGRTNRCWARSRGATRRASPAASPSTPRRTPGSADPASPTSNRCVVRLFSSGPFMRSDSVVNTQLCTLFQDDMAGVGRGCPHQSFGQKSCITGGRVDASCCVDSHFGRACQFRPGLATGVLCCKIPGQWQSAGWVCSLPPVLMGVSFKGNLMFGSCKPCTASGADLYDQVRRTIKRVSIKAVQTTSAENMHWTSKNTSCQSVAASIFRW